MMCPNREEPAASEVVTPVLEEKGNKPFMITAIRGYESKSWKKTTNLAAAMRTSTSSQISWLINRSQ